ncbi:helix-turn-helix domain-containing protein [Tenacibaculum aiptasiae]
MEKIKRVNSTVRTLQQCLHTFKIEFQKSLTIYIKLTMP